MLFQKLWHNPGRDWFPFYYANIRYDFKTILNNKSKPRNAKLGCENNCVRCLFGQAPYLAPLVLLLVHQRGRFSPRVCLVPFAAAQQKGLGRSSFPTTRSYLQPLCLPAGPIAATVLVSPTRPSPPILWGGHAVLVRPHSGPPWNCLAW